MESKHANKKEFLISELFLILIILFTQNIVIKSNPPRNHKTFGSNFMKPRSLSSIVVKYWGSATPHTLMTRARKFTTTRAIRYYKKEHK